MFMFIFLLLFGSAVIAFGIYAIKNPYSWWFRNLFDDREPSDLWVWYLKLVGTITIGMGAMIILFGTQHLFI
ncbi:hypothetical protein [Paenibacillus macquariensis]|uniref:DUF6199 domain-containing protein n=1 Tax=Paenibacillus macquariensis TaxID=948756 RepID=A0ABY1JM53_9BACL|nr:hypothetical protein [Paenibacillus macquariensis]MEC0090611.1 hypothetical protein [Paenibacillus macquariensis]OAB25032.1 hypothetical protein PMSM_28790 [Paenibacillus macquariensis subsp. macquariensis]SIQ44847.1 hypothetical protein SAMN05421578_10237 [Paenibacillus macquariensis]